MENLSKIIKELNFDQNIFFLGISISNFCISILILLTFILFKGIIKKIIKKKISLFLGFQKKKLEIHFSTLLINPSVF